MKIKNKIIISNVFYVALMVLIVLFAYQALDRMLTKLRFVEIADDLNASFLEMRLSEKNYFLYKDQYALGEIEEKIANSRATVDSSSDDISRAIGADNLRKLNEYLDGYSLAVRKAAASGSRDVQVEAGVRAEGKRLREFSATTTKLERVRVNDIISNTKKAMLISFMGIILFALLVSRIVSGKILRSLRKIEILAKSIGDGNYNMIEGTISKDELGSVITAVNTMSEEIRNREDEITQSKKLASLGVLTAGVAHEIINPVNNISMIAQTYAEVYDSMSREDRVAFMTKVEGEADRIREIVKNLLDFSKPKKVNLTDTQLNEVIANSLRLVQNILNIHNVEVILRLTKKLPNVFVDEHQIQQVFVNLFVNAAQAMPKGGDLKVSTRHNAQKGLVEVDVEDTGKGIPAEYLPNIFDPFFSTKGVDGTGLGLSVSYSIIKNHSGHIRAESIEGKGTRFSIDLPQSSIIKEENNGQIQDNGN